MSYYSQAYFSTDHMTLKSFEEKRPGLAVQIDEIVIKNEDAELPLKKKVMDFPNRMRICFEPEELIFKNIKSPVINKKLLDRAVQFECRKHFRISEIEFLFDYNIWNKNSKDLSLTLLGVRKTDIDKYHIFICSGFIPVFFINDFLTADIRLGYMIKKIDDKKESFRIYYNGCLIGWKIYEKESEKSIKSGIFEYIRNLGLTVQDEIPEKINEDSRKKQFSFSTEQIHNKINFMVEKLFLRLTFAFAVFLILISASVFRIQLNIKIQHLKNIEAEFNKLQKEYQIEDMVSIRKKTYSKGIELSRIILSTGQNFPSDIRISRFEYKNGEVALSIPGIDILRANQIKESLENEKYFTRVRIEEGIISNEKRIFFQVNR